MRRQKTIALLIDNLSGLGSYQENIWQGVSLAIKVSGDKLLIYSGGSLNFAPLSQYEQYRNIAYDIVSRDYIDGIVICGGTLGNFISKEKFQQFLHKYQGIPQVSIGCKVEGITSVLINNESGLLKMINHLIEAHNFRKIAFIGGPEGNEDAQKRLAIYRKALSDHNLPVEADMVFTGSFIEISGRQAVTYWLDEKQIRPEAIVGANDNMALGALKELQARGVHVPDEVAVVGFDDIFEASVIVPGLSTIRQPVIKQAQQATELLLGIIDGMKPESDVITLDTELVLRRSCGCQALRQHDDNNGGNEKAAVMDLSPERNCRQEAEQRILEELQDAKFGTEQLDRLCVAIHQAVKDQAPVVFIAAWEDFLLHSITRHEEIDTAKKLLAIIREKMLSEVDEAHKTIVHDIMFQAQDSLSTMGIRIIGGDRLEIADLISRITAIGTLINSAFEIEHLIQILLNVLPTFHMKNFLFALFKNREDPLAQVEIVCRAEDGKRVDLAPEQKVVSAFELFQTDFFKQDKVDRYMVLPLYSKNKQLGLLVMEITVEYGFLYEIIYSQLCSSVEGALLLEGNIAVKQEIEKRNQVIEGLSLPMVESIGDISQLTSDKMLMISTLMEMTKQSWQAINATNSNIDKIAVHSSKLVSIMEMIEEIAEQVNILALNTAIQAARVGQKYGAGFAVIAREIKQLADNTRRYSEDIGHTLKEIVKYTQDTARVGHESAKSFQEQEKGVDEMLAAFKSISVKMEKLMENSSSILNAIKKS